jgi:G:T-mismatch repair DNA endonuclease (very short patch repair protein)
MSEIMSQDEKVQKLLEVRSYPSEIKHWLRKGYSVTEAQELVTQYQKKSAFKQNNPETKAKQSARTKGNNNPMSLLSISSRHDVEKEEARKLTPCYGRKGENHPMYGKQHSLESLAKISKNASRHFSQRSSAEREIYEELIAAGYSVSRNVGVSRYNCDIVFDTMLFIVEYFGDFWHCNPEKWDAQQFNPRIKMTAEKRWALDGDKLAALESLGYKVLVVWESNWKQNSQGVIKEIVDASNSISRQN